MDFFGYSVDSFRGKMIVDVGCGSKLRSKFFRGARIGAIEPLANEFMGLAWSDLGDAAKVHAVAAETFVPELEDQADFVMCINVLDHVYDPRQVLDNVGRYLRRDGEFLLSVDCHGGLDPMHAVQLNEQGLETMLRGWKVVRRYRGLHGDRLHYGKGTAVTFVLRHATSPDGVNQNMSTETPP